MSRVKNFNTISSLDTMFDSHENYFRIGRSALEICTQLANQKLFEAGNILDFPSGYGRVLRHFYRAFPKAKLFSCELDSRMLEFTKNVFGAIPVQANESCLIHFDERMDLIWSGSLLTHLDDWQWKNFFTTVESSLSESGVCIFSTHGRRHAMMARSSHPIFGPLVDLPELVNRYHHSGFGFLPYHSDFPTFGLSLASPSWIASQIERLPGLEICGFTEGLWGQDIWAVRRSPWPLHFS